jgi:plastocyanin
MNPTASTRAGASGIVQRRKLILWVTIALLAATAATLYSCGSSSYGGNSNPTSPGPPKELNSGNITPGHTFEHRFAAAGTYNYHCIYHGPMTGSVTVSDAAADTLVQVNIVSSTSGFPGASVKTGGRVVWTNSTSMTHTVTSN